MRNIADFAAPKYNAAHDPVGDGVYRRLDAAGEAEYVASLSFEQEPDLGEGATPQNISQYPLEDLQDQFLVYVSDFYPELNAASDLTCYLEFAASDPEDVRGLRTIIGKHVYLAQAGTGSVRLTID